MRFIVSIILFTLSTASPISTASADKNRPGGWDWEIIELSGPGCPKHEKGLSKTSTTLERGNILYQVFSFPDLKGDAGPNYKDAGKSIYCDVTAQYTERPAPNSPDTSSNYKLYFNPNGTYIRAGYNLENYTTARWQFVYNSPGNGGSFIHDEIDVEGPISDEYAAGKQKVLDRVTSADNMYTWLDKCGSAIFKYRIMLEIQPHTPEAKGVVGYYKPGTNESAGVDHGFSFGWDPCRN